MHRIVRIELILVELAMNQKSEIDLLLQAPSSLMVAKQLIAWADETQKHILRGDMMIGILSVEDAEKIPVAYRAAAQYGDPDAWLKLAWWYTNPAIGEPDVDLAQSALKAGIEVNAEGAKLGYVRVLWFYKRESSTTAERAQAFAFACELVESNSTNAEALYYLALLITHGFGTDPDAEKGFELQKRAAGLGNTDAMFEIYVHHASGLGTPSDESLALKACERAANAGHSRAMYNFGAFNASGRGMPKNIPAAIEWYERAANEGNPRAMANLALIYGTGDGVDQDLEYAAQLCDQAEYCGLDLSELREQLGI